MAKKTKKIGLGLILGWFFGIIFGLSGLSLLFIGGIVAGAALILASLILLPPVNKLVIEKWNFKLSRGLKLTAVIILFIVYVVSASNLETLESDTNTNSQPSTQKTEASAISPCETFIDSQLPKIIKFSDSYKTITNWNDGTNISTLKDIREIKRDGVFTEVKTGHFTFYKGKNPGENINNYYIDSKIFLSDISGSETLDNNPKFYLEYTKSMGADATGVILEDRFFKINTNDYEITKTEEEFNFKVISYEVVNCKNI